MEITSDMARTMLNWFRYFEGESIPDSEDYAVRAALLKVAYPSELELIAQAEWDAGAAKQTEQDYNDRMADPSVRFDHLEYLEHRA